MPVDYSPVTGYRLGRRSARSAGVFPTLLGRQIYNSRTTTGLARAPVEDHINVALAGVDMAANDWPIRPKLVVEALDVDGAVVITNPQTRPELKQHCYCPDDYTIVEYLPNDDGCIDLRVPNDDMEAAYSFPRMAVWTSDGAGWQEQIYDYKSLNDIKVTRGRSPAAGEMVTFPNGRGVLYFQQDMWHLMEELMGTMRWANSGVNVKPVFFANVSEGSFTAAMDRAGDDDVAGLLFPKGSNLERPISNTTIMQLNEQYQVLREDWIAELHAIDQDSPNRPVASDREKRMEAMKLHVRGLREITSRIYALWGIELQYDRIVVQSPADRLIELQIIQTVMPQDAQALMERLLP